MTEIIIKNGTIYTMNPKLPKVSALAVMDGKFIYVGDDINALKLARKDSKIIKWTKRNNFEHKLTLSKKNDNLGTLHDDLNEKNGILKNKV